MRKEGDGFNDNENEEENQIIQYKNSVASKHENYKRIEKLSDIYPLSVNKSASLSMLKKTSEKNLIPKQFGIYSKKDDQSIKLKLK